jgi:hypothetical protein
MQQVAAPAGLPATVARLPIKEVTAIAGLLSLGVLLVYFWRIGYVPIDGFADALAIAGVALMSCGLMAGVLLALWVTPSFFQLAIASDASYSGVRQWLTTHPGSKTAKKAGANRVRCLQFSASSGGVGWLSLIIYIVVVDKFGPLDWFLGLPFLVLPLLLILFLAYWQLPRSNAGDKEQNQAQCWWFAAATLSALATVLPWYAVVLILQYAEFVLVRQEWAAAIAVLVASGGASVLTNAIGLALALENPHPRLAWQLPLVLNAVVLFLAVFLTGALMPFLDASMTIASIRLRNATLVLSAQGCKGLRELGIQVSQGVPAVGGVDSMCTLANVTVLSRLGQRWRIACEQNPTGLGLSRQAGGFTILASTVEVWSDKPPEKGEVNLLQPFRSVCMRTLQGSAGT